MVSSIDWINVAVPALAAVLAVVALIIMWHDRRKARNAGHGDGTTITDPNMAFTERKGTMTMGGQQYRYRRISATSAWIKPARKRWWRR